MTDYEFVCNECGRTFRGLTGHIGEEMCPECGGFDISRTDPDPTDVARSGPVAPNTPSPEVAP